MIVFAARASLGMFGLTRGARGIDDGTKNMNASESTPNLEVRFIGSTRDEYAPRVVPSQVGIYLNMGQETAPENFTFDASASNWRASGERLVALNSQEF